MAWQLSKKQQKIIECIASGMPPKKNCRCVIN